MKSIWTIMLNVLVRIGQLTQCATRAAVRAAQHAYSATKRADQHVYRAFVSVLTSALKTVLVCAISVAMWLPVCLTAETAVAADGANNSSTSAESAKSAKSSADANKSDNKSANNSTKPSNTPSTNPSENPSPDADTRLSAFQSFPNSNTFVTPENPFKEFGSNLGSSLLSQYGSQYGSAYKNVSPLERAAETAKAQAQARAAQDRSDDRDSYPPYTPGCNKDYALGECFTTTGDGAGLRATNGHDLDVNGQGYRQGGAFERNRGYYKNGPVPEDPSGFNHFAETYFTPYPKGTYIVKRLRNLAYDDAGRGIDSDKTPLDDVADFVFVKRTPKAGGGGFVWDVVFNAGGRTHGAADALNYFTVPENQILDKGSEGGRQYIQRILYTGREHSALYLKNKHNEELKKQKKPEDPNYVPPRETCSFSWDNPNGLCSIETNGGDVLPDETIADAWIKSNDHIKGNNGYSHIINTPQIGEGGNQEENYKKNGNFIGTCNDGYALDCMHSTNYGFPSVGDHQLAPKLDGAYSRGFSPAYVKLIDNLYKAIRGTNKTKIFLFTNKLKNGKSIPYTYKIHFTTTTARGHENDSFFYGAGSYFGATSPSLTFGKTDPFGAWSSIYSLQAAGRFSKSYRYTSLYEQWYGVPRIMDVQSPRLHFLKGTGLGPFGPGLNKNGEFPVDGDEDPSNYGNNGKYIARYGICTDSSGSTSDNCQMEISSMLLEDENGNPLINRALASSPNIQETKDIRLLPDFYSPNNNYARGNQWFRYPGVDDHNTKDSTPGRHKLQLKYHNDYYQISETQDLWYRIIEQADVFKPLQTEEWNKDDKTPTYYSYDKPLPNPIVLNSGSENKGFVNFEHNRGRLYSQVKAFDPNLYTDVLNRDETGNEFKYGSVKDTYPLDKTYRGSSSNDANDLIKNNAVYKAEWTDKWGDNLKSNTLKDAETKIAAKVPIVTVSNRCAHSKILDDFKDETDAANRSASNGDRSANYANRDGSDRDSGDRDSSDRDSNMPECWPKPQKSTERNVWYIYYAPKGSKQGDPVPENLIKKTKDKASSLYSTWMRNGYSAQLQDGKSPEVLPNYVFVKYLKITFWDNSTTVIPVVFPYVDYEKPTLDVKVSVNNGKPMTVPADGLKIATKSRIKFWVKGHDDRKIMLGVNGKKDDPSKYDAEIKKYVGKDFHNDFDMITKSKSGKDCAKNGCGNFTTISYNDFVHDNGMPNTETDKEGWVINDAFNGSNGGSPQVDVADRGVHDLIFHGWDEVGNSVIKKIRLIIVSPGYGLPNVWWDKKRNGHYVGRVNPWDEDKRVRSIMVRIWPRGKDGPAETKDKSHGKDLSFDEKCPTDGSCYGIIIQRRGNTDRWEQVNTYKGKNLAAGADASRAADDDRSADEDKAADEDRAAAKDRAEAKDKAKADGKSADGKAADGKAADKSNKSEKTETAKPGENSTQNQQSQTPKQNQNQNQNSKDSDTTKPDVSKQTQNNKPASLKIATATKKTAKKHSKKNIKKRNIPGRRGTVKFAVLKEGETNSDNSANNAGNAGNAANSEGNNLKNNADSNGEQSNKDSKENKAGKDNKIDKDNKSEKSEKSEDKDDYKNKDRSSDNDRSARLNDNQLREKYSKRVITSDLDKHFKGCTVNGDDKCEITFDPATGNIEIPEYFAEIGSRIYVDAYSVAENTPNKSQNNLWPIIGDYADHYKDHEESDPLPLDITWPNGLVQVSPFELNDSETGALLTWMRHDNKNERIFGYRKEEIGIKGEDKYDTYNRYDASNFTYAYGESKPQYSCKADNNHKNDLQWKLCLDISPKRIEHKDFPTAETASNMKHSKKNLTIDKLEANDETVLNPATHEVTRYVNMRKDYKWDLKGTKVGGRESDPGLKWYGDRDFGNEYLVYKWDINTKKRLNTNAVLDLIKGTPSIPDPINKPQPSLKYLDGSKNKHDILYGPGGNGGWDGDLPDRGNWYGYAPNDGTCKLAYADNLGKCQWENVLDLVKYDSVSESDRKGSFADDVNVNMELKKNSKGDYVETGNEVSITDRINQGEKHSRYAIRKHFLMPGGANVNGQADGLDIGDTDDDTKDSIKHGVILENRRVRYVNAYDDVPTLKGSERENQEQHAKRYFAKRPFMHAQLYVHNGSIVNDLTFRVNGDQNTTTNVINVWFVPVDGQKPTISGKSYPEKNKAWNIHGRCMLPGQGKKDCTPIDDDLIDLDNNDWYNTDTGTLLLPENLKLDDDFNAYTPTGQIDVKSGRRRVKVDTGQSSKALLGNLQIDIEADGVKDSKGRTPRIRFVRDGYEDKYLVRRFIERYRSTDLQNPDPAKPTTFRMFAKTSDSVGNESEETAVGCFKTKWTKVESPSVVAYYDGENNDNPANSDKLWLNGNGSYVKKNGQFITNAHRDNVVKVTTAQDGDRMVVYYHPNSSQNNANSSEEKLDIGKTLAVCWVKIGLLRGKWQICDGTTKPDGVGFEEKNGNGVITFPKGFLAPGSVVRARERKNIGPWTWMPGVKSIEELVENSDARNGNRNKSVRSASVEPAGAASRSASRTAKSAKRAGRRFESRSSSKDRAYDANEDTLDVLPMEIAKERTDEVCRPDNVKPSDWKSKPSDCVYFDVSMRRRIVQVHPMLLSNLEQRAIRLELTKENHNTGKWLGNDSEVVTNDDIKLGAGKTMVTFREYDYNQTDEDNNKIYTKPEGTPSYGSIPQEKQDLVVFTSGWRSRVLVPLPRKNQVTRFVRLRSVNGINSDGGGDTNKGQDDDGLGNGAADYVVDVPMKNGTQDRSKAPKIKDRPDDPGLVLSPDKKSLFYVYNLSDKTPVTFNDLQSVVNLKLNENLHPDNECKGLNGKALPFADCQPSLRAKVKGSDKVIAEGDRTDGLNAINGNMMYTLLQEGSAKTSFINIIDMQDITEKQGHKGGGSWYINVCRNVDGKQVCGETADENPPLRTIIDFAGEPRWGSSGAIDRNFKLTDTNKIFDPSGNGRNRLDNRLIMSLGVSWVDKTIYDARGRESEGSDHEKQDEHDSVDEAVMPVYLVATDNVKPTVKATGPLKGTTVENPYGVDVDNIDFTFNTVSADEKNKHSDSNILLENGKKRFIDAYDDYDTRETIGKNLDVQICRLHNSQVNGSSECASVITKSGNSGSTGVNKQAMQDFLKKYPNTGIYAVCVRTTDSFGNQSANYVSNNNHGEILGYIRLGGINVRPVALPYSGGQAAIWFSFLFGVLLALAISTGAFGRRGWLASVLSGNGFGALTDSKHCDASAEALRCGGLFKWLRR